MDSLTQIALGAAIGEAVGGRKLGNKAMFWGAVAGTIPDLDVFMKYVVSPIDALAAHRGISHSLIFAIIGAFLLAYLVHLLYRSKWYKPIASGSYYFLSLLVLIGINRLLFQKEMWQWYYLIISGIVLAGIAWLIHRKYNKDDIFIPDFSISGWRWLFFLALVTHPILDCFTVYGTQLFMPFHNYRVAFNNISVVDPIYTIFLIAGTMIAARIVKTSRLRKKINIAGLVLSSIYMLITFYNKNTINTIFEKSLDNQNIAYSRYMTGPTIFNNILWYSIAESDSAFHYGFYSLLEGSENMILKSKPKTRGILLKEPENHTIKTLNWFSKEYNIVEPISNDSIWYYDLRYGPLEVDNKEFYPFKMLLVKDKKGEYFLTKNGPPSKKAMDMKKAFSALYDRIGL